MGLIIRAALGFAIAFAIRSPAEFATYFETPQLQHVKAEIAAEQPEKKLWALISDETPANRR
jgi:hypothetical protein